MAMCCATAVAWIIQVRPKPLLQQLLLMLFLMHLCKCNNLSNDLQLPINLSTTIDQQSYQQHPHASVKSEPASIDLLHLWHLIHPPNDATALQAVRVNLQNVNLSDFTKLSTQTLNHNEVPESVHKVPYYVPTVCKSDSPIKNASSATIFQQSFQCLPSAQYTCNGVECLCKDKSTIMIHVPPIGQLCLSQDLKLNQSCLLDSQCLTGSGFRCQPNEHLNGSSALQQFVALFALRWRVALLAASAGLSNELHAELGWNHNNSALSLDPLNSESSFTSGTINSIDGDSARETEPIAQQIPSKPRFPLNSLFNRLASELADDNSEHKLPGRCACATGYFLSYALRYDTDGIASRQLHSLLNGVGSTLPTGLLDSMISGKETPIAGRCVRIRSLGEPCQLSTECMKADPQTSCRRNRCACRSGFTLLTKESDRLETDDGAFKHQTNNGTVSVTSIQRTSQCVPKHLLLASATNPAQISSAIFSREKNGASVSLDSSHNLKRNCSPPEIFCIKSGKCIRRPLKRHLQQNLVSIVWTMLCLLSILIVLGSLLARGRRHRRNSIAGSHGSLNHGPMGARALSNGSIGSLSLLGVILGRTVAMNNLNSRTPVQQQLLATCTPPPEFSDIMDPCPTYEEACRMLQKSPDESEQPDQIV